MTLETGSPSSAESFQKLMYELLCVWHGVKKQGEAVLEEGEKKKVVRKMICRLLVELDKRIANLSSEIPSDSENTQKFFEEWAMLTWNVLCVTMRLCPGGLLCAASLPSEEERLILAPLNTALVKLVNKAYPIRAPPGITESDQSYKRFFQYFGQTLHTLHNFYSMLDSLTIGGDVHEFVADLATFGDTQLRLCIETFKEFSNQAGKNFSFSFAECCRILSTAMQGERLWIAARAAQVQRMTDYGPLAFEAISPLIAFYTNMIYTLGILAARLQGFRYESTLVRNLFVDEDPVFSLVSMVFAALELLLSDAVLATEPSTNAILVTNNLFPMQCGALVRGVLFRDFQVQVVSEETAAQVQVEMRRQKLLQHAGTLPSFPSAALLAVKPATGVKRNNATVSAVPFLLIYESSFIEGGNTAHKKSDVNSKESVFIIPTYNSKHRFWSGSYPHLLCTTRQKRAMCRELLNVYLAAFANDQCSCNFKDSVLDSRSAQIGKRPLFYFHVKATFFSPAGGIASAHTLSLPFTIATRRNQARLLLSYRQKIEKIRRSLLS
ncbi:unnamed protein product [Toxocara canis]|uniref:Retinoblastoma-like protein 1 n=1 Tax=Toxocara canis TaxID=6265 RepID=A0A183UL81_TOXCA|nr:unnamed protein product [Toxocara canis]